MARYSIQYQRKGEPSQLYEVGATSEQEARNRFLALSWVGFEPISIVSVALKGDQPEADKEKVRHARKTAGTRKSPTAPPGFNPEAEMNRLTEEIGDLADKAQALRRAGEYDAADALRAKAKTLAATRAEITRRNKKK